MDFSTSLTKPKFGRRGLLTPSRNKYAFLLGKVSRLRRHAVCCDLFFRWQTESLRSASTFCFGT